ncbi:aldo/keto reductase [Mucilaginibacter sp. MD40]|uniref:aldo/keto reductase n=1 Tax=Mucilaginibacter sp. MD40 TaxID=2029590 RepID=UPI000BACE6AB|nr:aldo/keto reductase [Mucilaginibacter sp. MD40]PAW92308.1 aldo/keto reductase [Mucilaginibacter sp. MD40]
MKHLPAIALGTWSWGTGTAGGDQVFGNRLSAEQLKSVFDAAVKSGLNLWDTAAVYGMGSSEIIVGELAKSYDRQDLILSTKFTPQVAGTSPDPVAEMLNGSFTRLNTDYIDIYWIHNPSDVARWTPGLLPLLKSGKVKSVGVSNHNLEQIRQANAILAAEGFGLSAVQNHYSLLYRSSEDAGILDYCKANNMTFFAYMVLEQGALSGKYNSRNPLPEGSGRAQTYNQVLPQLEELTDAMSAIGESKSASVAQIAMAWAVSKGTVPIIGVTKVPQVEEAAAAAKISLSEQEIAQLETLAAKAGVDTRGSWEEAMV